ncbi:MAG TPA: glycosyltransferase [Bacteroidales bacterium]|nr:glycosyltransferase [Bacteroidales bacterium]
MTKKTIVISAINLRSGGTLTILQECLKFVSKNLTERYKVVALVHKKDMFPQFKDIEFIEFPDSVKSYFFRIYYEYFYFKKISKKLNPYLWISLHDMTPNVISKIKAVYCHNPTPFCKISLKALKEPKFILFNLFYKYIYKVNIHSNDFVIVQQEWLREKFSQMFEIPKGKIIVAYPETEILIHNNTLELNNNKEKTIFFYPVFPRFFKNFEVICEAVKLLNQKDKKFEVIFTIDGKENRYSKWLFKKYGNIKNIKFIGLQSREKIYEIYNEVDCLIFPSKLETWGLPLSEFKTINKPIIVSDLPYVHETIGKYDKVVFSPPDDFISLSKLMNDIIENKIKFHETFQKTPTPPFARNWAELFGILLKGDINE